MNHLGFPNPDKHFWYYLNFTLVYSNCHHKGNYFWHVYLLSDIVLISKFLRICDKNPYTSFKLKMNTCWINPSHFPTAKPMVLLDQLFIKYKASPYRPEVWLKPEKVPNSKWKKYSQTRISLPNQRGCIQNMNYDLNVRILQLQWHEETLYGWF